MHLEQQTLAQTFRDPFRRDLHQHHDHTKLFNATLLFYLISLGHTQVSIGYRVNVSANVRVSLSVKMQCPTDKLSMSRSKYASVQLVLCDWP